MSNPADQSFGSIRFVGGRYEQFGLPISAMAELERYSKLVGTVAHFLYLQRNPRRKRVPRGFDNALELRLIGVEQGSVVPVLERAPSDEADLIGTLDIYEESRRLINSALREAAASDSLPFEFPRKAIRELVQFGRSLGDDERIELSGRGEPTAILDKAVRQKVQRLADLDALDVETVVLGQVTGLRSKPQQFDLLLPAPESRSIQGTYSDPAMFDVLWEFTGFVDQAPLASLAGVVRQGRDGELLSITDVLGIEAALPPAWTERIREIASVPDGWLSPLSVPPTREVLDILEVLLLGCVDQGLGRPLMFPSGEGGVQLEWRGAEKNVEIEILNSGKIEAAWFEPRGDGCVDRIFLFSDIEDVVDFVGANVDE